MASSHITSTELNNYVGNQIAQQIFAYIYDGSYLTSNITERFKKSLIVLGKEGQIYNPLTNTYIGIGTSEKDKIHAYITAANNKIDALNTSLTASLVSAIYANWDADDWKSSYTYNNVTDESILNSVFATNNIVLKGDGNYDTISKLRATKEYAKVDNSANISDQNLLDAAYKKIESNSSVFADSGISVSLVKGENEYRYEYTYLYNVNDIPTTGIRTLWIKKSEKPEYRSNLPTYIYGPDPLNPDNQVKYNKVTDSIGQAVYRNGKNVFTIDDKQTWSYIASAYAYTLNFAQDFAKSEVNRIYSQLLGKANNSIVPVSYASINEMVVNGSAAFTDVDAQTHQPLNTFVLNSDTVFYEKIPVISHLIDGQRTEKALDGNGTVAISYKYSNISANNTGEDNIVVGSYTCASFEAAKRITVDKLATSYTTGSYYFADFIEGTDETAQYTHDYVLKLVAKHSDLKPDRNYVIIDPLHTPDSEVNILDGIQTLKEVAHVLDQITNGSGDGIELAYSIAQNHIDIVELDRRLDAVEDGRTAVRSIENLEDGKYVNLTAFSDIQTQVTKEGEDIIHTYNYGDVKLSIELTYTYIGTYTSSGDEKVLIPTREVVTTADGTSYYTTTFVEEYYTYGADKSHDALVDTNWAFAYGAELTYVAKAEAIYQAAVALDKADQRIDALDASHSTQADHFISGYKQENGLVTVTERVLPQDKVTVSSVVWGKNSSIEYTAFTKADEITEAVASSEKIYTKDAELSYEMFNLTDASLKDAEKVNDKFKGIFIKTGNTFEAIVESSRFEAAKLSYAFGKDYANYVQLYTQYQSYSLVDNADIIISDETCANYFRRKTVADTNKSTDYITAETHQNLVEHEGTGETTLHLTTHITKVVDATADNTGLVDAWDLRQTLANMFEWVDLSEFVDGVNPLNQPGQIGEPTTEEAQG